VDDGVNAAVQATIGGNPVTVQYAGRASQLLASRNQIKLLSHSRLMPVQYILQPGNEG
jgi:hypothetical protein